MDYLVHDKGEQKGPYREQQVRSMWTNGSLTSSALYWIEGASEWMPLVQLCESKQEVDCVSQARPQTELNAHIEILNPKAGKLYSVFSRNYPRSNGTLARSTIDTQDIDVHKTSDNSFALKYTEGVLFKSHHVALIARDTKEIGLLPDAFAQNAWKHFIAKRGSGGFDLLSHGLYYAANFALAKAEGVRGFYLHFNNEEGNLKQVVLLGNARLIESVLASLGQK